MRAISELPRPTNIIDLRSYYKILNHVLNYYHVSPHLVLFRELMKKSVTWYWEGALEKLFEASSKLIAKSVMDGITR